MSAEYQVEISKTVSVIAPDEETAIKNAVTMAKRDVIRNAPSYFVGGFDFAVTGAQNVDPEPHSDDCEKCTAADEAGEDED